MEISTKLCEIDAICDYIPMVSTVTNLIDLFQKSVCKCFSSSDGKNRYWTHIEQKDLLRCLSLLVPLLGNIYILVSDYFEYEKKIQSSASQQVFIEGVNEATKYHNEHKENLKATLDLMNSQEGALQAHLVAIEQQIQAIFQDQTIIPSVGALLIAEMTTSKSMVTHSLEEIQQQREDCTTEEKTLKNEAAKLELRKDAYIQGRMDRTQAPRSGMELLLGQVPILTVH